jgi:capsular polysaccharide export protein
MKRDARPITGAGRRFLFLQGPHGPFFDRLARTLRAAGASVWRVGFNAGDALFWSDRNSYIPFRGPPAEWPGCLDGLIADLGITDIALYGDTRPIHAVAKAAARAHGLTLHVFEEGYLRPWWVTHEHGGANANAPAMALSIDDMRAALGPSDGLAPAAPARWGDLRAHVFYGALYHFPVLFLNRGYPGFRPHRDQTVGAELRAYLRRLLALPLHATRRFAATRAIRRGGFAYHLVLLQLAHDASVRAHSRFTAMEPFIDLCLDGFANGAPPHHHLVVKGHPLDDGRAPLRRHLAQRAAARGLGGRVHFVPGGKLAPLLDAARSVVTINSTAAQQALWRGLPVRALGRAIYCRPELVSEQPLDAFSPIQSLPTGPPMPISDAICWRPRRFREATILPAGAAARYRLWPIACWPLRPPLRIPWTAAPRRHNRSG